jgi:hypothetical protein
MNRRVAALWCLGLALRLAALPLPGTGDVVIWKTWSVNAVASGVAAIYGVGGQPPRRPEYRSIAGGSQRFKVDYPPLSAYAVAAAGRIYRTFSPDMPDSPAFNACVKLAPLAGDVALAGVLFYWLRRYVGRDPASLAVLACWLNPAILLNGAVLGYLDPLFLPLAVAAVLGAAAGSTWLAGALCAAAILTKPQGALVVPAVALAVVGLTWTTRARVAERLALRVGEAGAGGLMTAVAVVSPFAVAGALPNLLAAQRSFAEQDILSGNAANLWWIVTWVLRSLDAVPEVGAWKAFLSLPRLIAVSSVTELGYPDARVVGLVLLAGAWTWAIWSARRARDPWLFAGVGAFLVHAYFLLAANVHENHLLLALPLAVVASAGRPRWRGPAFALTVIHFLNLNLFYGFSEAVSPNLAIPRSITGIDAVVVLSVVNLAALGWHASVLLIESRLSAGPAGAETTL